MTGLGSKRVVTYAVGDIHGRLDLLSVLLDLIVADAGRREAQVKIVFTGDYLDRGHNSYGVIERLIAGPERHGDAFVCLRGNHDELFVRSVMTGAMVPDWAWFLFDHTLESYAGVRDGLTMTDRLLRHVDFISALPLTHDDGTYFFVHAGVRPNVPLADQNSEDLLWIREEFLDHAGALPRRIVHGHTIMGNRPIFTANRISVDTGAFRSGFLTAIVLDGGEESFIQAVGEPDRDAIKRESVISEAMRGGSFSAELSRIPGLVRAA